MNTTPKKRATRPLGRPSENALADTLASIREKLGCIKASLAKNQTCRQAGHGLCRYDGDTRYLSEPQNADYQLLSPRLGDWQDALRFCTEHFRWLSERALQEELHVLTLNGGNRVIRSHQVTIGPLNATQVHPREVFRPAILDSAAAIILVHNHPSGQPSPSKEDQSVTDSIEKAGKLIGIKLLDHIVVERDGVVSDALDTEHVDHRIERWLVVGAERNPYLLVSLGAPDPGFRRASPLRCGLMRWPQDPLTNTLGRTDHAGRSRTTNDPPAPRRRCGCRSGLRRGCTGGKARSAGEAS